MEPFLSDACGIEVNGKFVVTGGVQRPDSATSKVREYTEAGDVTNLRSLNTGRYAHACSKFVNDDGDTVSSIHYIVKFEIKQFYSLKKSDSAGYGRCY